MAKSPGFLYAQDRLDFSIILCKLRKLENKNRKLIAFAVGLLFPGQGTLYLIKFDNGMISLMQSLFFATLGNQWDDFILYMDDKLLQIAFLSLSKWAKARLLSYVEHFEINRLLKFFFNYIKRLIDSVLLFSDRSPNTSKYDRNSSKKKKKVGIP